jgi:hypothetical protein
MTDLKFYKIEYGGTKICGCVQAGIVYGEING